MYPKGTLVVCSIVPALLGACADATGPAHRLEVSITTSSATVNVEQPITITVAALNQGRESVRVGANSCPEAYRVETTSGELVAPGPTICALAALTKSLRPGEQLEFSYTWGGTTRERVGGPAVQLPAASYELHGVVFADGEEVTSSPIGIEVQP